MHDSRTTLYREQPSQLTAVETQFIKRNAAHQFGNSALFLLY